MSRVHDVDCWTVREVADAIASIGPAFQQYRDVFQEHGVDGVVALNLDMQDCVELGIKRSVHRKAILSYINGLRNKYPNSIRRSSSVFESRKSLSQYEHISFISLDMGLEQMGDIDATVEDLANMALSPSTASESRLEDISCSDQVLTPTDKPLEPPPASSSPTPLSLSEKASASTSRLRAPTQHSVSMCSNHSCSDADVEGSISEESSVLTEDSCSEYSMDSSDGEATDRKPFPRSQGQRIQEPDYLLHDSDEEDMTQSRSRATSAFCWIVDKTPTWVLRPSRSFLSDF